MDLAVAAAQQAGDLVAQRRHDVEVLKTKSSATDVVTAADGASEELLHQILLENRPEDGILGEEGAATPTRSGITWVVDPIDGTVNYLYGIPVYAVSVAAVSGGIDPATWQVEAAAVVDVARGITYSAGRGIGAYRDQEPLKAANRAKNLDQALVGTGFGYIPEVRSEQARILTALIPHLRDIRRIGAAALDMCMVAAGELDAYYEQGLNPWDFAAATLVCREAGLVATSIDADAPMPRMTLVGHLNVVQPLRSLLIVNDA